MSEERARPGAVVVGEREPLLRVLTGGQEDPLTGRILNAVCLAYGLTRADLTGPRRRRPETDARRYAAHLMREMGGLPLVEIADALGRPRPSGVQSMLQTMSWRLAYREGVATRLDLIRSLVIGGPPAPVDATG